MDQPEKPTNKPDGDEIPKALGAEENGLLDYFQEHVIASNEKQASTKYTLENLKIRLEQEKTRFLIRDIIRAKK